MNAIERLFDTPMDTLAAVRTRAIEAVLGQCGVRNPTLAAEIRRIFGSQDAATGALVRDPVLEAAIPYLNSSDTLATLRGQLIDSRVIDALTCDVPGRRYRFPSDLRPYVHQIEAWRLLTEDRPRSVLISSGTGSGKTECFLIPLLHDLAKETTKSGRLSGIRAIALYPLNALIASQEERLREWTAPFAGKIRFGLYNSNMPSDAKSGTAPPEQVIDRRTLRQDPPPILVTNITMLEYMTVRREDRPMIEASKGKLRWIILDEAHSYVGSAAAEIALLLRRVLLAFDVDPAEVRFVATSATIGEGEDTRRKLETFLTDVAGLPKARVTVIEGQRRPLDLPPPGESSRPIDEILAKGSTARLHLGIQKLMRALEAAPMEWRSFTRRAEDLGTTADVLARTLTRREEHLEPLIPLRVHGFMRAVPGLWTCLDPKCPTAPGDLWPFGGVLAERADHCPHCHGNMQEVVVCSECGEPFLQVIERNGRLVPAPETFDLDEFAIGSEREDEGPEEEDADSGDVEPLFLTPRLIATSQLPGARPLHVEPASGRVLDAASETSSHLRAHDFEAGMHCPLCAAPALTSEATGRLMRPIRYGAPFLVGNAIPVMLDGVPPREPGVGDDPLPANGRQMLTFTDSRQGTARFAASIQTNAERTTIRSLIYFAVQDSLRPATDCDPILVRTQIDQIEQMMRANPSLAPALRPSMADLLAKLGSNSGISWGKLRDIIGGRFEVAEWIRDVWRTRDERFDRSVDLFVQFLMMRELLRRPRRANAVETLGLAQLRFEAIDGLRDGELPASFRDRGLTLGDWQDYLYQILTHFVRSRVAVTVARDDVRWLMNRGFNRFLCPPSAEFRKGGARWPSPKAVGRPSNAVAMLERGLDLDSTRPNERAEIADILERAWRALLPLFSIPGAGDQYALDLEKAHVAPVLRAAVCPVTRRFLDHTFLKRSPYGLKDIGPLTSEPCAIVELPRHPDPFLVNSAGDREPIKEWLLKDDRVLDLRVKGLWSNLHDRIALGAPYVRAAEHSAQQPPRRLRRYEEEFKSGRINVLNCSTTMEMGVDIGSVAAVTMTNVPPSIANYRQRVGRAGRRGQSFSTALTYAKDTPLDRETFLDPIRYLTTRVEAPKVSLDSRRIVQRHVNAFLLAQWFGESHGEALKTEAGNFFGCTFTPGAERQKDAPITRFIDWLERPSTDEGLNRRLAILTKNSALEGETELLKAAQDAFSFAEAAFSAEWNALQEQAATLGREAARSSVAAQLKRMCREYLLGELADRGVLPGHGFPTAVVPFVHTDKDEESTDGTGENPFRRRNYPTRNLDVAIRDYAPGADVVVDGLVYRSAGVTLNWKRPAHADGVNEIQNIEWHWQCSTCGGADISRTLPAICEACGADLIPGDARRFLEPAGFTVDLQTPVHADIENIDYVEPEPERVSAREAEWLPFADPERGRLRASRSGLVFYASAGGPKGTGYAVCLACGRAEREKEPFMAEEVPMVDHRPLRFTKANPDGTCPGNERSFAIQRRLILGHDINTDVCEVQFSGLADIGTAWTVASALRESLSRLLGVASTELGLSVSTRTNAIGGVGQTIHIYDRASGGAGYSPRLVDLFEDAVKKAAEILDCDNVGCERGCSACVMTRDLHDKAEILNRKAAVEFIRDQIAGLIEPGDEDRATQDSILSRHVADELVAMLQTTPRDLVLQASESLEPSGLDAVRMNRLVRRYVDSGRTVSLAVPATALNSMDAAQRMGLRDAIIRNRLTLCEGGPVVFANGANVLAALGDGQTWASRDATACRIGETWGTGTQHPVVRFRSTTPTLQPVDLDRLLPERGACFLEVDERFAGPSIDFGERVVSFLRQPLEDTRAWLPGHLRAVQYRDRYVRSPLAALLVVRTLAAIAKALGGESLPDIKLSTDCLPLAERRPGRPWLIDHDWQSEQDRQVAIAAATTELGVKIDMQIGRQDHSRLLRLVYPDFDVRIFFDQGFGFMKTTTKVTFDFAANAASQGRGIVARSFWCTPTGHSHVVVSRGR